LIWNCQSLPHRTFCLRVYAASGRSWDHAVLSDSPACKQMVTRGVRCNNRFSPREYPTIMSLATFASGSWGGSTVVPVITRLQACFLRSDRSGSTAPAAYVTLGCNVWITRKEMYKPRKQRLSRGPLFCREARQRGIDARTQGLIPASGFSQFTQLRLYLPGHSA
jgi:hypothetical protein